MGSDDEKNRKKKRRTILFTVIGIVLALLLIRNISEGSLGESSFEITYSSFKDKIREGAFSEVVFSDGVLVGYAIENGETVKYMAPEVTDDSLVPLLEEMGISFTSSSASSGSFSWFYIFYAFIPILLFYGVIKMATSGAKSESKGIGALFESTPAKRVRPEGDTGIRFRDIAGEDESKAELEEIVDYLKFADKYRSMGARVPKGCLLVGPPGTGKTLLARAVAGEAGVPFYKVSGADFVEMFVGVGAARVRELFSTAREKSPSIIFIDEIDAIGKVRGYGQLSGNDEREQTLNQLLVEMDGFDSKDGVIVLAATNRAEILDPALLRPGRFDRQVYVDKPDMKGRHEILRIHTKRLRLSENVDLEKIARSSSGLAGADLANIANEAALMAVRRKSPLVEHIDFENALEKSIAGLEKKSRVLSEKEKEKVSYHETGHALTAYMTEGADPVSKISIIPRGSAALGYTLQLPKEDRFLLDKSEIIATIDVLLGGRAAEDVIYGEISTGAMNDISRASDISRDMIAKYGMSDRFRNVALPTGQPGYESGYPRLYSEKTQEYIDGETAHLIAERYMVVKSNLEREKDALIAIASYLKENEVIEEDEFASMASSLLNKRRS